MRSGGIGCFDRVWEEIAKGKKGLQKSRIVARTKTGASRRQDVKNIRPMAKVDVFDDYDTLKVPVSEVSERRTFPLTEQTPRVNAHDKWSDAFFTALLTYESILCSLSQKKNHIASFYLPFDTSPAPLNGIISKV